MKRLFMAGSLILTLTIGAAKQSRAQSTSDCVQQLILDYQKLASLKNILSEMYNGYSVISKGYNAVKGVAQGNFSLHQIFLDGLYLVSPAVRKYPRITDIVNVQAQLVKEYRAAATRFKGGNSFGPEELGYMTAIYDNLGKQSLKNLDALATVITDSRMRMSDAERLTTIDRIFRESRNQLSYLRKFNEQAQQLAMQRARENSDREGIRSIYGIN